MMKRYVFLLFLLIFFFSGVAVALAERLAVAVPVAKIRSGPGPKHDILWKVEKHHPLSILKKIGSWYYFRDFEGDEGWIHNSVLNKTPSIITKKEDCNVRSGPGTRFKILFTVEKGIPFEVVGRKGKWLHIRHADGDEGWIYKPLVW